MKKKEETKLHPVIEKIRKIINDKGLTQAAMAEYAGTTASQFSKILNGEVQISLWQISNIATNLNIDIIDIFTYPEKYVSAQSSKDEITASLTIQLKKEKKDQILKLVFGDNNLEILNK